MKNVYQVFNVCVFFYTERFYTEIFYIKDDCLICICNFIF